MPQITANCLGDEKKITEEFATIEILKKIICKKFDKYLKKSNGTGYVNFILTYVEQQNVLEIPRLSRSLNNEDASANESINALSTVFREKMLDSKDSITNYNGKSITIYVKRVRAYQLNP